MLTFDSTYPGRRLQFGFPAHISIDIPTYSLSNGHGERDRMARASWPVSQPQSKMANFRFSETYLRVKIESHRGRQLTFSLVSSCVHTGVCTAVSFVHTSTLTQNIAKHNLDIYCSITINLYLTLS